MVTSSILQFTISHWKHQTETTGSLKWSHVLGSVSLLALLGIPWIFSTFGAIDTTKDSYHLERTEAVFQVRMYSPTSDKLLKIVRQPTDVAVHKIIVGWI